MTDTRAGGKPLGGVTKWSAVWERPVAHHRLGPVGAKASHTMNSGWIASPSPASSTGMGPTASLANGPFAVPRRCVRGHERTSSTRAWHSIWVYARARRRRSMAR